MSNSLKSKALMRTRWHNLIRLIGTILRQEKKAISLQINNDLKKIKILLKERKCKKRI